MSVANINSALVGFALFDAWAAGMQKINDANRVIGSPLVDAAFKAFEGYIDLMEIQHASLIAGAAVYALNPNGASASAITVSQMAPFLALNVLA